MREGGRRGGLKGGATNAVRNPYRSGLEPGHNLRERENEEEQHYRYSTPHVSAKPQRAMAEDQDEREDGGRVGRNRRRKGNASQVSAAYRGCTTDTNTPRPLWENAILRRYDIELEQRRNREQSDDAE